MDLADVYVFTASPRHLILHRRQSAVDVGVEKLNESPRSKLRGITHVEFIDFIEASFEELTRRD
jgi:hypothetical protein